MPPKRSRFEKICGEKRKEIEEMYMKQKDKASEKFVCEADLKELWTTKDFDYLFPTSEFASDLRDRIKRQRVLLTILVYIKWADDPDVGLVTFRQAFRTHFVSDELEDEKLPLSTSIPALAAALTVPWVELFLRDQYIFKPYIIKQNADIKERIPQERRLPFCLAPVQIGSGSYGKIFKTTIAKGCYVNDKGHTIQDEFEIAYKFFEKIDDYNKEGTNMKLLKDSLSHHDSIVKHMCDLPYGETNLIFTEYTRLGDLETLLNGGYKGVSRTYSDVSSGKEVYKFDSEFNSPENSQFIKQLENVADALKFIHKGGVADRLGAHMDLKPNNILVYPDESSSLSSTTSNCGKWVLADFGIAFFSSASSSQRSYAPYLKNNTSGHGDSWTKQNLTGAHRAPELQTPGQDENRIECDRWSFGCIINEVFAFISGKTGTNASEARDNLWKFRRQKIDPNDDNWFEKRISSSGSLSFAIKPKVLEWIYNFNPPDSSQPSSRDRTNWKQDMARLILDALQTEFPNRRIETSEMKERLSEIYNKCMRHENEVTPSTQNHVNLGLRIHANHQEPHSVDPQQSPFSPTGSDIHKKHDQGLVFQSEKKDKVEDFDLAPDGSAAAFLVSTKVSHKVYLLRPNANKSEKVKLNASFAEAGHDWGLCIGVGILIVRGWKGRKSRVNHFYNIKDLQDIREINPPEGWPPDCKKLVGSLNFIVWETSDQPGFVHFWDLISGQVHSKKFDDDIKKKQFNAKGNFLFIWSKHGSAYRLHLIDLTKEGLPSRPPIDWQPGDRSPREFHIWPSQDAYFCAVQEAGGGPRFLVQFSSSKQNPPVEIKKEQSGVSGWASALTNNAIFVVRKVKFHNSGFRPHSKSKTVALRRQITFDGMIKLDDNDTQVDHPQPNRWDMDSEVKMAVSSNEAGETIVLCNRKAEYFIQFTPRSMVGK